MAEAERRVRRAHHQVYAPYLPKHPLVGGTKQQARLRGAALLVELETDLLLMLLLLLCRAGGGGSSKLCFVSAGVCQRSSCSHAVRLALRLGRSRLVHAVVGWIHSGDAHLLCALLPWYVSHLVGTCHAGRGAPLYSRPKLRQSALNACVHVGVTTVDLEGGKRRGATVVGSTSAPHARQLAAQRHCKPLCRRL